MISFGITDKIPQTDLKFVSYMGQIFKIRVILTISSDDFFGPFTH